MKNKYQRLNKEEKKKVKEEYKASKRGFIYPKFIRMFILCTLGMIYGIGFFIYDFISNGSVWSFTLDSIIILVSFFVYLKVDSLYIKELNNFVINKK